MAVMLSAAESNGYLTGTLAGFMTQLYKPVLLLGVALTMIMRPVMVWSQQDLVGVLISREIAPYIEMVEGLENALGKIEAQRFFLDKNGEPYSLGIHGNILEPEQFKAVVAVGPEALLYLKPKVGEVPLVYGMILNPEKIFDNTAVAPCGVSLNLPIYNQLASIQYYLPGMSKLGIFYDPQNNQPWVDEASVYARELGIELIPLQVRKGAAQLAITGDLKIPDAILFIPDKTIISKAVVQYVIKQAYLLQTPVIGYNQFFHDSGAALSFVVDYRQLGSQVAEQVLSLTAGGGCLGPAPPRFKVQINKDSWRVLALPEPAGKPANGQGG